ncbi:MAG: hypothetical protein ACYDHY_03435 [Acidiferrobacterales bacterium]
MLPDAKCRVTAQPPERPAVMLFPMSAPTTSLERRQRKPLRLFLSARKRIYQKICIDFMHKSPLRYRFLACFEPKTAVLPLGDEQLAGESTPPEPYLQFTISLIPAERNTTTFTALFLFVL